MEVAIAQLRRQVHIRWSEQQIRKILESPDSEAIRDREIRNVSKIFGEVSAVFEDTHSRIRKYRRLAFIHRLPVECLCKIFRAAGDHGLDVPTSYAIPLVCLRWRDVAYSDPQMWTRYNLAYSRTPAVATALLQRSQPCSIEFYGSIQEFSRDFEIVAANMGRASSIQDVLISFFPSRPEPHLTAPLLRHIGISSNTHSAQLVFPDLLFIKDAPLLTSLELFRCRLPWRRSHYSNLTHLRVLKGPTGPSLGTVPLYCHSDADIDILEVFYGSPDLEYLEIQLSKLPPPDNLTPSTNFPPTLGRKPVAMRALRTLVLDMPEEYAMRILTGITLPESLRKFDLITRCDAQRADVLHTLLQCRYLPTNFFPSLRSLFIMRSTSQAPFPASSPNCILFDGVGHVLEQDEYRFTLRFDTSHTIVTTYAIQQLLPTHVDMRFLQTLSLSENVPESVAQSANSLARLLLNLPSLDTLILDGAGFFTTFERLHCALLEATNTSPNHSMPSLLRVHIKGPTCIWVDISGVVPLLRLFQAHLRELRIDVEGFVCAKTAIIQLVEGVRSLGVPEVWWHAPFKLSMFAFGAAYVRDIWPSGVPYTWRCKNEENHSVGESSSKCEACGAALRVKPPVVVPAVPDPVVPSRGNPFTFGS